MSGVTPHHPPPEITSTWEPPAGSTQEEAEVAWLKEVYQGDSVPQLTFRALAVGVVIGAIMSVSNLYVGLKTGWSLGASITAVILAYAFFSTVQRIFPGGKTFTVLENNTMQTAASAAAYMSSAGLVSAIPALYMTTGQILSGPTLIIWMWALSLLGVFLGVPMKRQMIGGERLKFPSGIACAETLRSMHSHGAEAMQRARALGWSGLIGAVVAILRDNPIKSLIPATFSLPGTLMGVPMSSLTLGAEGSMVMLASGAIIGLRVGVSLLIGATLSYAVAGPILVNEHIIESATYRNITSWTLWPGVVLMLTYSIAALGLQWRMLVRAFSGISALFGAHHTSNSEVDAVEIPSSWFMAGFVGVGALCVILQVLLFDIVWWTAILAVLLTFLLCVVAARATGETDITPVGPMGKLTQLMFGVVAPANMTANLMAANVSAGAASHAADLLTDLKAGYLVGANPRRQFVAQLVGVTLGAIMAVPAYDLLVVSQLEKRPDLLGSADYPAPAAQVWAKVAQLLAKGLDSIPESAQTAMLVTGILGVAIALLESYAPRTRRWLPSPMGLGIACTVPFYNSFSMFVGSVLAWMLARTRPDIDEKYTVVVSSGLIAGETLCAVLIIVWTLMAGG